MSQADHARKASTPWRAKPIHGSRGKPTNRKVQAEALAKMSVLERECGMTEAEWLEFHRVQRERVLARWGT